jgi:hypothetical protein
MAKGKNVSKRIIEKKAFLARKASQSRARDKVKAKRRILTSRLRSDKMDNLVLQD